MSRNKKQPFEYYKVMFNPSRKRISDADVEASLSEQIEDLGGDLHNAMLFAPEGTTRPQFLRVMKELTGGERLHRRTHGD